MEMRQHSTQRTAQRQKRSIYISNPPIREHVCPATKRCACLSLTHIHTNIALYRCIRTSWSVVVVMWLPLLHPDSCAPHCQHPPRTDQTTVDHYTWRRRNINTTHHAESRAHNTCDGLSDRHMHATTSNGRRHHHRHTHSTWHVPHRTFTWDLLISIECLHFLQLCTR